MKGELRDVIDTFALKEVGLVVQSYIASQRGTVGFYA